MASVVSICNLALSNIGKDNISTLNEASTEARACNQFYEHVRDTMLQSFPWNFARKTAALAETTNTKSKSWAYAYVLPNDCLKVMRVTDVMMMRKMPYSDGLIAGDHQYEIEGQIIYCNVDEAYLEYTQKFEDVSKFSPMFVEALGWALAVRLAMPLTRDPKIRAEAFQLYQRSEAMAQVYDANQVRHTSDYNSEFYDARQ